MCYEYSYRSTPLYCIRPKRVADLHGRPSIGHVVFYIGRALFYTGRALFYIGRALLYTWYRACLTFELGEGGDLRCLDRKSPTKTSVFDPLD